MRSDAQKRADKKYFTKHYKQVNIGMPKEEIQKNYEKALQAYHADPVTYSQEEVERELGLR